MKKTIDNIENIKKILGYLTAIIGSIVAVVVFCIKVNNTLNTIQKTTLRTAIWAEGLPSSDKTEACDSYLGLGYNSETKKYCEKLLEKEFKESELNEKN